MVLILKDHECTVTYIIQTKKLVDQSTTTYVDTGFCSISRIILLSSQTNSIVLSCEAHKFVSLETMESRHSTHKILNVQIDGSQLASINA